jgi:hypothetical protein
MEDPIINERVERTDYEGKGQNYEYQTKSMWKSLGTGIGRRFGVFTFRE